MTKKNKPQFAWILCNVPDYYGPLTRAKWLRPVRNMASIENNAIRESLPHYEDDNIRAFLRASGITAVPRLTSLEINFAEGKMGGLKITHDEVEARLRKIRIHGHTINLVELARKAMRDHNVFGKWREPRQFFFDIIQQMFLIILCADSAQSASWYKYRADKRIGNFIYSGNFSAKNKKSGFASRKTADIELCFRDPELIERSHFDSIDTPFVADYDPDTGDENDPKYRDRNPKSEYAVYTRSADNQTRRLHESNYGHWLNPFNHNVIQRRYPPYYKYALFKLSPNLTGSEGRLSAHYSQIIGDFVSGDPMELVFPRYFLMDDVGEIDEIYNIISIIKKIHKAISANDFSLALWLRTKYDDALLNMVRQSERFEEFLKRLEYAFMFYEVPHPGKSYIRNWEYLAYLFNKTVWQDPATATCFIIPIEKKNAEKIEAKTVALMPTPSGENIRVLGPSYTKLAGNWWKPYKGVSFTKEITGYNPLDKFYQQPIGIPFYTIYHELGSKYRNISPKLTIYQLTYVERTWKISSEYSDIDTELLVIKLIPDSLGHYILKGILKEVNDDSKA